ncbi:Uncharacterized protein FWK35_00034701, partial [Aphis craccivora]
DPAQNKIRKLTEKEPTYKEIETIVISRIENIWIKAYIPIVERKRIKAIIKKIPVREQNFLIEQRTSRKMVIGSIDIDTTNQMRNTMKRKLARQKLQCNSQTELIEKLNISISPTSSKYDSEDRVGAAIVSAVLHNANCDSSEVIDKNKLRRKRKKTRQCILTQEPVLQIPALYFNGRKDKTLCNIEKDGQKYRQIILEEHISLIKEPESIFLGYITPTSGTSKCIEQAITDHFLERELSMEWTNGGIIRLLEKKLNKPLQWIICLLHMNELSLRHLFVHIDGSTTGSQTFSGEVGKQLESCEKKSVVQFQPISAELPELLIENLSSDQKYLYRIVSSVITGIFPEDLKNKSPGKMSHARWLTRANIILRIYVPIEVPSENLTILAMYVVKVYAPTWFSIKIHPTCKDGAYPVIQRNSYFAHPENLFLAMLSDLQKHIRELAARRILKVRYKKTNKVRPFKLPNINFNASSYIDLIDWQQNMTEPPILKTISDGNIQLFVEQKGEGDICLHVC